MIRPSGESQPMTNSATRTELQNFETRKYVSHLRKSKTGE